MKPEEILPNFRSDRYAFLNKMRWDLFLKMEIPVEDRVIFEPGAGVGDQTEWLLGQGAKRIYVNEGRPDNMEIIRQRFGDHKRLKYLPGDIEKCLNDPEFNIDVDLVFMFGVYYHMNDSLTEFNIMRSLSRIGPTVVFDYLESFRDGTTLYDYDNPSTSISRQGIRPTTKTMMAGLKKTWGYAYLPEQQIDWVDPLASDTPRRLAVGSKIPLKNPNLIKQ